MINAADIRNGTIVIFNGEPCRVIKYTWTVQARQGNSINVKMKNILTGRQVENKFSSDEKVEETELVLEEMEFLYNNQDEFVFMNQKTFEQISMERADLEDVAGFLLPNTPCTVQFYDGRAIGVTVPNTVQLKVTETEPHIKGATASGKVTKSATLETGLVVQVPMFVERDDTVIIGTQTGEYQGRPGRGQA